MRRIFIITLQSLKLLVRDKIFYPATFIACMSMLLFDQYKEWGVADNRLIFFNLLFFCFYFLCSLIAIFWGTKLLNHRDAYLEMPLSTNLSRSQLVIARYLALSLALFYIAAIFIGLAQIFLFLNQYGFISRESLFVFVGLFSGVLVVAALSIAMSSLLSPNIALFSTLSLWIIGLTISTIYQTLPFHTPGFVKVLVENFALVWDLQRFNYIELYNQDVKMTLSMFKNTLLYFCSLITLFLTFTCFDFSKKDINY
ncbi:MAG: hypothetical protein KBD78_06200 [Oligoflexales bacterium]|nr:hypothetical protein [Oligoflexales bacterium]